MGWGLRHFNLLLCSGKPKFKQTIGIFALCFDLEPELLLVEERLIAEIHR